MPAYVSPQVATNENDFSGYVGAQATAVLGLVSTAARGPVDTPVFFSTESQFLETCDVPQQYGGYGAVNFLRRSSQLYFIRVARKFTLGEALFVAMGTPVNGKILSFTVQTGSGLQPGDYVRITQSGRATTQNVQVVSVDISDPNDTITVNAPLIDTYTNADSSDCSVDSSDSFAVAHAENFGVSRYNGTVTRNVRFTAKDPGAFANFNSANGIEVQIQDGGLFANIDPTTGLPSTANGFTLQGILPSAVSIDSLMELFALNTNTGAVIGQTRGVNSCAPVFAINQIAAGSVTGSVNVLTASTSSSAVTVASVPTTLVNGSTLLGSTVSHISGTNITLSGNANVTIASSTPEAYTTSTGLIQATFASAGVGTNFAIGNQVSIAAGTVYDGVYTLVAASNNNITMQFTGASPGSPVAVTGYVEQLTSEVRYGVVLRCTAASATGSTWVTQGVSTKRVIVLYNGVQKEVFDNIIGYDDTSSNYWDTVIGSPATGAVSNYIYAEYFGSGEQPINTYNRQTLPNNPRILMGTQLVVNNSATSQSTTVFINAAGNDGDTPTTADYIGNVDSNGNYSGMWNFYQADLYPIDLLAIPGITTNAVIQAQIDLLTERHDCFGVFDTPYGLSVQQAVDWHNGSGIYTGNAAFVTNLAAMYFPWVKQFDNYSGQNLWLPPSCFLPGVIAYNDQIADVYYAPAGYKRGRIPGALGVSVNTSLGDRNLMYGPMNGNALNPIVNFPKDGIEVFGQRTLQRVPTALDRINVRRLVLFLEKAFATVARQQLFEPDDAILWAELTGIFNPILQTYIGRALEDALFVCDASTNTPTVRDQNMCVAQLYLIPVKAAEVIQLNYNILASTVSIQEFIALNNGGILGSTSLSS